MQIKILLIALLALLVGCDKKEVQDSSTFTLESRVEVTEVKSCKNSDVTALNLTKLEKSYVVKLGLSLPCESDKVKPYVTLVKDKKATLVFSNEYKSGCECAHEVSVKVTDRFDEGDTLYVSANGEVIGHVLVKK
jgi:hypothetical protein